MGIEHGGTQKAVLEILQGHDVPRLRIAENFAHFRAVNPVVPLKMRALGEIIKPAMSGKAIHDRGGKFKGNAGGSQKGRGKGGGLRSLGFSRKYAAVHHSGTISVENARKRSKIGRVMKVETFETPQDAAKALAGEVAELIRTRAAEGKNVVLGLATGATPLPFYAELVRMHKEEGLSFANVISFNLDEYSGLDRDHPESYWYFMHTNLFNHIDIKPENINLPSGTVKDDEIAAHCAAYEQKIKDCGGIDLQILGIGRTGHIGFNEPGSDDTTVTRQVHLDELTRSDAAPAFGGIENVPTTAITMGVATIMAPVKWL